MKSENTTAVDGSDYSDFLNKSTINESNLYFIGTLFDQNFSWSNLLY